MDRFKRKLTEQISFLESSCKSYDAGNTHEAFRIALSLRIIFYSSKNSTSLLKHMSVVTNDFRLLSTGGMPKEKAANCCMYYGLGLFQMGGLDGAIYRPSLGDGPPLNKFLSLKDWWKECVYVLEPGKLITRFNIMIGAANNDGGAHVDDKLEPLYESLSQDGALGTFEAFDVRLNSLKKTEIVNANHVALRQMAYEVLHSPDFNKLAK